MLASVRHSLGFACLILAGACASWPGTGSARDEGRVGMQRLPEIADFRSLSGIGDSLRVVVRDASTWQALWVRIQGQREPKTAAPLVDFSGQMVVAVALGSRGSTGYAINVDSVRVGDGMMRVFVTKSYPASGSEVGWMGTAPLDAVRVPRYMGTVTFVESTRVQPSP
jgi:hypothetical protein